MTAHYSHPLDGGAGAHAIKIAAAAQEAVKHLPHVSLGAGDIDRILSQTAHGSLSIEQRVLMAGSMAQDIAKGYLDQQRNATSDTEQKLGSAQNFGLSLTQGGWPGFGRLGVDGSVGSGSGGRSSYQAISYASAQSIQGITSTNYLGSPFSEAGIHYGTFSNLRAYDRNFTGQDILRASTDVKALGFDVNNERAMRNHATIRHYDNNPEGTNKSEQEFQKLVKGDAELLGWIQQRQTATDPTVQKDLDSKIEGRKSHYTGKSGVAGRISDPKNHPKAKEAIKDDIDMIMDDAAGIRKDFKLNQGKRVDVNSKRLSADTSRKADGAERAALAVAMKSDGEQRRAAAKSVFGDDDDPKQPPPAAATVSSSDASGTPASAASKKPEAKETHTAKNDPAKDKLPDKPVAEARQTKAPAGPTIA